MSYSKTYISLVVLLYFIVSISLVFSNKLLLTPGYSIPVPLFTTWYQCMISWAIIYVLGYCSQYASKQSWTKEFTTQSYSPTIAVRILPLSLIFVSMITFNNLCLKYVEVSFYNIARALTIVMNVIFSYIFLHESTSLRIIGTLMIVIIGFFVGSNGEINFSLVGTLYGVLSSTFVCLNSIYTKKMLILVNNDKWNLSFYNNCNASLLFIPLIILTDEISILYEHIALLFTMYYWCLMTIAALLGFVIGIVTVMQINCTSPLTHNISGTTKACVQTILALIIWRNPTTWLSIFGNVLVIGGSMMYAYVRLQEMDSSKKK